MSYRDDDAAHATRAGQLVDEIAALERQKIAQVENDRRLEAAKRELATLQVAVTPPPEKRPGWLTHVVVFGATASAAYFGYSLLLA